MSRIGAILSFFFCLLIIPVDLYAIEAVDILTGYLNAPLDTKDDYEVIPLMVGLNFDLKPLTSRIGIQPKGRFNFVLEPFFNIVSAPDTNIEVGSNFLFKYTFPLTERFQPYLKVGAGVLYMSQHTKEQSTQYNFLPQAGGGLNFFIRDDVALICEYRYRHLSNCSFKTPNAGIDADMILGGISFFFE